MIAHSLPAEAFGPAQGMHGATFVAEVTFRREDLDRNATVMDIGVASEVLDAVLAGLNYRNLDEHPDFTGQLTTTEVLARYIAEAVASRLTGVELAGIDVVLRENPDAWAGYSLDFENA